jgi:hypothetical protein
MQYFPKNLFCTIRNLIEMLTRLTPSQPTRVATWRIVSALMFRSVARFLVPVGIVSVSILASSANAQIVSNLPNPTAAPNPLRRRYPFFVAICRTRS